MRRFKYIPIKLLDYLSPGESENEEFNCRIA